MREGVRGGKGSPQECEATAAPGHCRLPRRLTLEPSDERRAVIAAVLSAAREDSSYFSPEAMMAFTDVAVRTGHLSALVGTLACAFPEDGGGSEQAVKLALSRLAACAIAWLEEIGAQD